MQLVADIAPNQQRDEGADGGVVELGCHSVEAFVHRERIQPPVKLRVDPGSEIQQVGVDLGATLAGVRHSRTCHVLNVVPSGNPVLAAPNHGP